MMMFLSCDNQFHKYFKAQQIGSTSSTQKPNTQQKFTLLKILKSRAFSPEKGQIFSRTQTRGVNDLDGQSKIWEEERIQITEKSNTRSLKEDYRTDNKNFRSRKANSFSRIWEMKP